MSNSIFKNFILLSGQNAPFTGDWQTVSNSKNSLFSVFASGVGTGVGAVTLQYKNPFFNDDAGVPFYIFTGVSSGYATPSASTSPMGQIRAVSSGSGQFWAAVTIQN